MSNEVVGKRTGGTVIELRARTAPTLRPESTPKALPVPNFETFNRSMVSGHGDPRVTVLRSGMLSLNKPAYLALGSPEAVELLYDGDEQIIGLRPVDAAVETAYIVRHPSRGTAGPFLVTALAFTKYYDIDITESLRWDASMVAGVLCVRLTEAHDAVTSNRVHHDDPEPSTGDPDVATGTTTVVPLRSDESAGTPDQERRPGFG